MDPADWRTAADPYTDEALEGWASEPRGASSRMRSAEDRVREALGPLLDEYAVDVYAQGGYANRTAVTTLSDIDIVVASGATSARLDTEENDPAVSAYRVFRNEVHDLLRAHLDRRMPEPRLACRLHVGGHEVDVLPCLSYPSPAGGPDGIWFWRNGYATGPEISWPRRRALVVEERDVSTDGAFRPVVRALKGARDDLWEGEDPTPGFIVETLTLIAPPGAVVGGGLRERCRSVLQAIQPDVLDDARARRLVDPVGGGRLFPETGRSPSLDRAQHFVDTVEARLG